MFQQQGRPRQGTPPPKSLSDQDQRMQLRDQMAASILRKNVRPRPNDEAQEPPSMPTAQKPRLTPKEEVEASPLRPKAETRETRTISWRLGSATAPARVKVPNNNEATTKDIKRTTQDTMDQALHSDVHWMAARQRVQDQAVKPSNDQQQLLEADLDLSKTIPSLEDSTISPRKTQPGHSPQTPPRSHKHHDNDQAGVRNKCDDGSDDKADDQGRPALAQPFQGVPPTDAPGPSGQGASALPPVEDDDDILEVDATDRPITLPRHGGSLQVDDPADIITRIGGPYVTDDGRLLNCLGMFGGPVWQSSVLLLTVHSFESARRMAPRPSIPSQLRPIIDSYRGQPIPLHAPVSHILALLEAMPRREFPQRLTAETAMMTWLMEAHNMDVDRANYPPVWIYLYARAWNDFVPVPNVILRTL